MSSFVPYTCKKFTFNGLEFDLYYLIKETGLSCFVCMFVCFVCLFGVFWGFFFVLWFFVFLGFFFFWGEGLSFNVVILTLNTEKIGIN